MVNGLEQGGGAKRPDAAKRRHAPHQGTALIARADHHVGALRDTGEHLFDLLRVVGIVAIHDHEHVAVRGIGHRIVDERAQARAQALVDDAVEDHEPHAFLPRPRGGECRIGAAVVVEDDGDRLGRTLAQAFDARQQPRQRDLLVVGR